MNNEGNCNEGYEGMKVSALTGSMLSEKSYKS